MIEFPEELLQALVECIALNVIFIERQKPMLRWKYQRTELLPLSRTNRQLRRICFPFLFAYIVVNNNADAEKLKYQCAANEAFAASIRCVGLSNSC